MKTYANYIWDFDGNIFDSYPHTTQAMMILCESYGIKVDRKKLNVTFRHSFEDTFKMLNLSEEQIAQFNEIRYNRELEPVTVPFEQTRITLETLKSRGARHFLYTHSDRYMSVDYLEKFGMLELFDECVTSENNFASKPSPDAINYLVEKYNMDKNETIMVGDREIDVMSGVNAGVKTCLFDKDYLVKNTKATNRITQLIQLIN